LYVFCKDQWQERPTCVVSRMLTPSVDHWIYLTVITNNVPPPMNNITLCIFNKYVQHLMQLILWRLQVTKTYTYFHMAVLCAEFFITKHRIYVYATSHHIFELWRLIDWLIDWLGFLRRFGSISAISWLKKLLRFNWSDQFWKVCVAAKFYNINYLFYLS
jgi:hypothetical protein